jgi:hypothetical protein
MPAWCGWSAADEVRARLEAMGIGEAEVAEAVAWARGR